MKASLLLFIIFATTLTAEEKSLHPVPNKLARDSYKLALGQATAANKISVPEGFSVDVIRSANADEGSWIALEFGDANQLFVAREDQGIIRFSFDANGQMIDKTLINQDIKECRGLLWAYDSLYVTANGDESESSGLFRLRDKDENGTFETVDHLLKSLGSSSVDKGRNQLRLGPDGNIYFMCGSAVAISHQIDLEHSFLRNFEEDDLVPNPWDLDWASQDGKAPGGHLVRMDKDGKGFQLVAGGFTSPMDVVFNRDHEMFTFDGDVEWDSALPWYRPSRVLHVVAGADFGWRRATSKWPEYYEDSLPSVVDIGLGVPTGMEFGYQSKFPKNWQNRLFIGDWAYGRIIAVDMQRKGGSYSGVGVQTFAFGRPLNVMDITFGSDGDMYFVTGGRKTKSAIYRVRWNGKAPEMVGDVSPTESESHVLRRKLEFFHLVNEKSPRHVWPPELATKSRKQKQAYIMQAVQLALKNIDHQDRFVRHAARLVLENQSPDLWVDKALQSEAPSAFIALARVGALGGDALVKRMNKIDLNKLPEDRLLAMLRAYQVSFIRHGLPNVRLRKQMIRDFSALFPSESEKLNHELVELLVYLDAPGIADQIMSMIDGAETTESLAQYLIFARYLQGGWDLEVRRTYLQSVQRLEAFAGGEFHQTVVDRLRVDIGKNMTRPEHLALSQWMKAMAVEGEGALEPAPESGDGAKYWTMDDFTIYYNHQLSGRNFGSGIHTYSKAKCAECHDNQQMDVLMRGPSLSQMARLSVYDLMAGIIHPSRSIDDKYRDSAVPNLSAMPTGLIDGFEKDQVIDLLAYLKSGGNSDHPVFKGKVIDVERVAEARLPVINEGVGAIQPYAELDLPQPPQATIEPSLFRKNSAANQDRQRVYQEMKAILDRFPDAKFELIGHADDTKWTQTNYDISVNRARFTVDYLVYLGIPRGKFTYRGVGSEEPSEVSNRRVEIKISY